MYRGFANLHVHSEFSLLDGVGKIKDIVGKVKALGQNAIAITDHGNMSGVIDFYEECKSNEIKPIIGVELYLVKDRTIRNPKDRNNNHLILLAKNNKGYHNLIKIVSDSWIKGFYYRPRTDLSVLKKYNEGLIVLSSCMKGRIAECLLNNNMKMAVNVARSYKKIWGNNFYIELQPSDLKEYERLNLFYMDIAKFLDIPLVVTNDCHYINKGEHELHNILLLIQTRKTLKDVKEGGAFQFDSTQFYLKTYNEIIFSFKRYHRKLYKLHKPEIFKAIKNTIKIAEECNVNIPLGVYHLPTFIEDGDSKDYFKKLCNQGWSGKIEPYISIEDKDGWVVKEKEYVKRYEHELNAIIKLGFVDYFLIIWDLIKWAKENGIRCGGARGSVASSLVAYILDITEVDPIKYDLIFERFINPSRTGTGNIPDIDMDFQHNRRDEVKNYLIKRWGKDKVAGIITYGVMRARGTLKDVGRVYGLPFNYMNNVTMNIPWDTENLKDCKNDDIVVSNFIKKHPNIYEIACKLEYTKRHSSRHAAGIVISKKPLLAYCPLQIKNWSDRTIMTQWDMDSLAKRGLLKLDILGLKTLTLLDNIIKLIYKKRRIDVNLGDIPYNDKRLYREFQEGNTVGVFQFERDYFKYLLRNIKPESIYDLAVINALGRPGAKLTKQGEMYVLRKKGIEKPIYYIKDLRDILGKTYGIIVFQEHVMEICHKVGGISLAETNEIRESIKHFRHDVMGKYGKKFIDHAVNKKGITRRRAEILWGQCKEYSNYGFNKSHSIAYSMISYQTMWFKVYYKEEFFCSLLNLNIGNKDKITYYLNELGNEDIRYKKPHIMKSGSGFILKQDKVGKYILGGLVMVDGIGEKIAERLLKLRSEMPEEKYISKISKGVYGKLLDYGVRGLS